ncbi:Uncharacterised protein [Citrobacter youngae]|uniref:Uncharacterized protein n=1 Tax=Citrobacter youngae TaxID=133448 RepID=A0A9Q7ZUI0_9ENTR|nr:Uncharacterised protein [Citrobacter youngae]
MLFMYTLWEPVLFNDRYSFLKIKCAEDYSFTFCHFRLAILPRIIPRFIY